MRATGGRARTTTSLDRPQSLAVPLEPMIRETPAFFNESRGPGAQEIENHRMSGTEEAVVIGTEGGPGPSGVPTTTAVVRGPRE